MSLDVYLELEDETVNKEGSGIFVREDGQTKEISRKEWDEKFPGREPIVASFDETDEVYSRNITHNLTQMANVAGLYYPLWRPEEIGITKAEQLIGPLLEGLGQLRRSPEHFKQFNPSNGWGSYEGLVEFVEEYLKACKEYPEANVRVSR